MKDARIADQHFQYSLLSGVEKRSFYFIPEHGLHRIGRKADGGRVPVGEEQSCHLVF